MEEKPKMQCGGPIGENCELCGHAVKHTPNDNCTKPCTKGQTCRECKE